MKVAFVAFLLFFILGWSLADRPTQKGFLSFMACSSNGAGAPLWLPVIATMRARVPELLWSIKSSSAVSPDNSPSFRPRTALFPSNKDCAARRLSLWTVANRSAMEVELDSGKEKQGRGNLCLLLQLVDDLWGWGLLFAQAQSCSNHYHWTDSFKDKNIFRGLFFSFSIS